MSTYADYLRTKLTRQPPTGLATVPELHVSLFPHQRDLTSWALRRGRAAVFAATGLGKMRIELQYAHAVTRAVDGRAIILAPLAVAQQISDEAALMGMSVPVARTASDHRDAPVIVTNYDRFHLFDASDFVCVVGDESSRAKHFDSKTFTTLRDSFAHTPYRLFGTATPAPNDHIELGTHAEMLGLCTRAEMLAEFFVHDGGETQTWRLKGHARKAFWRWVASWGAMIQRPSDLGYSDDGYVLPPLTIKTHVVEASDDSARSTGMLFAMPARTLTEQRSARRGSLSARVEACARRVNEDRQPWVVWCDLNDESEALTEAIPDAIEVRGSQTIDEKEEALSAFARGDARVVVSKASICGWGVNWQHVARQAFVGVNYSWESQHQAIRRSWRYGQRRLVEVHRFVGSLETDVVRVLERKERDAEAMMAALSAETREAVRAEVQGATRQSNAYEPREAMSLPVWLETEE